MNIKPKTSFAFLVLMYNHEAYILEHLESIKYLVKTYGRNVDVDVILSDDSSMDQTRKLADEWLLVNRGLFRHIKTIYNPKNVGTCASVNNMLAYMKADRCKLTAGDDVYSFENIFELATCSMNDAMVSGRTLYLLGNGPEVRRMTDVLAVATQVIYQHKILIHRFKHFSYNNAPNLFYATECLLHPKVRSYLQRFDVVEDWPLQVAIAKEFPTRRFLLINQVLVYYRRTMGSTYIVANQRFLTDKNRLYRDLMDNEPSFFERVRLGSRKFCLNSKNFWIRKILNLDAYYFAFAVILNLWTIHKNIRNTNLCLNKHRQHYSCIKLLANNFSPNNFE